MPDSGNTVGKLGLRLAPAATSRAPATRASRCWALIPAVRRPTRASRRATHPEGRWHNAIVGRDLEQALAQAQSSGKKHTLALVRHDNPEPLRRLFPCLWAERSDRDRLRGHEREKRRLPPGGRRSYARQNERLSPHLCAIGRPFVVGRLRCLCRVDRWGLACNAAQRAARTRSAAPNGACRWQAARRSRTTSKLGANVGNMLTSGDDHDPIRRRRSAPGASRGHNRTGSHSGERPCGATKIGSTNRGSTYTRAHGRRELGRSGAR